MNRHRLLTLLAAPLLAAPAVTPAFAAPAPAAPAAAPAAASCELVATGEGGDTSYTLVLEGFDPGRSVTVNGPRGSRHVQIGAEGSLQQDNARYGRYSVAFKGNRIDCLTPPRQKPDRGGGKQGKVQVTKVEITTLSKSGTAVDCSKPNRAEFDGRISGTGKGDVPYFWTFASSSDPIETGKAHFDPGIQSVSLFKAVDLPPTVNGDPQSGFVTLHVPSANLTARSDQVTFTCAKP
ncbi:hypothetical protein ABZW32_32465 [Streptomyces sp. NPDC004667]|uniref:hypothetical protein n=1 Tax=Streptomyces sp. NPDC004667 TaxID=3154285 RepID=UPI0033BBEE77